MIVLNHVKMFVFSIFEKHLVTHIYRICIDGIHWHLATLLFDRR